MRSSVMATESGNVFWKPQPEPLSATLCGPSIPGDLDACVCEEKVFRVGNVGSGEGNQIESKQLLTQPFVIT